jgi:translation elongation factor EF-Ts
MLRPNSIDFVAESDTFKEEVDAFLSCIQKYAHSKLQVVTKSEFARTLISYVFEDASKTQEFIECNPSMLTHPDAYKAGVERFIEFIHC